MVLVPFYRGAVVFNLKVMELVEKLVGSRPLLSRSGCISNLEFIDRMHDCSRPLLSRSGCIST